jgi:hypothetical protein
MKRSLRVYMAKTMDSYKPGHTTCGAMGQRGNSSTGIIQQFTNNRSWTLALVNNSPFKDSRLNFQI